MFYLVLKVLQERTKINEMFRLKRRNFHLVAFYDRAEIFRVMKQKGFYTCCSPLRLRCVQGNNFIISTTKLN
jgi:hypothetical protein